MFHMFTSIYPLHFDVKYIHIRIHIISHENFTQKTRSTASIYILQGNSTAAATVGNMMSYACQLLLMRTRARRAYCKKCRPILETPCLKIKNNAEVHRREIARLCTQISRLRSSTAAWVQQA